MAHRDASLFRGNAHDVGNIHIRAYTDVSLACDIDRKVRPGLDAVRDLDVAVPAIERNAGAGFQFAVISDDEVSGSRTLLVGILVRAGGHRDVAGFGHCGSLNGNGAQTGFRRNILLCLDRLFIRRVVGADDNVTFARVHGNAFAFGHDGPGNEDDALAGNIRCDISGFGQHRALKQDAPVPLHLEASIVSRNQGGVCRDGRLRAFGQGADVDAAGFDTGLVDLDVNVVARREACAQVLDSVSYGDDDIIAGLDASADAVERSVRAVDHNVVRRLGVSLQPDVLAGRQRQTSLGAVSAKNFNFLVFIRRMKDQNSQVATRIEIGKHGVALDVRPYAHREVGILFPIVIGRCFDASVNRFAARQGIGQEDGKVVLLAFHGDAFAAVGRHYRRRNAHARGFPDGAARVDEQRVGISLLFRLLDVNLPRHPCPGRDIAIDGHVSGRGCDLHIVGCVKLALRLHVSFGLERDVAARRGTIAARRGNVAVNGHGAVRGGESHIPVCSRKLALRLHVFCGLKRDAAARRGNIAANGHGTVRGGEEHISAS